MALNQQTGQQIANEVAASVAEQPVKMVADLANGIPGLNLGERITSNDAVKGFQASIREFIEGLTKEESSPLHGLFAWVADLWNSFVSKVNEILPEPAPPTASEQPAPSTVSNKKTTEAPNKPPAGEQPANSDSTLKTAQERAAKAFALSGGNPLAAAFSAFTSITEPKSPGTTPVPSPAKDAGQTK